MPFPESNRVIYQKNPLEEVLCQVQFSELLRLKSQPPADFQDEVRDDYPKLRRRREISFNVADAAGSQGEVASSAETLYDFFTEDEKWRVVLGSTFLAIGTTAYTRWEEFRERLEGALQVLERTYRVRSFTRIGLRYRDAISREALGLTGVPWTELLHRPVAAAFDDEIGQRALVDTITVSTYKLDVDDSFVKLRSGPRQNNGAEGSVFILDTDFYREAETSLEDVFEYLNEFNARGRRLFRWCIKDQLHHAMDPREP